jgi:hypothetical protein
MCKHWPVQGERKIDCKGSVPDDGRNMPKHVVHANAWYVYTRIVSIFHFIPGCEVLTSVTITAAYSFLDYIFAYSLP